MHPGYDHNYGEYPLRGQLDRSLSVAEGCALNKKMAAKQTKYHSPYLRLQRRLQFEECISQLLDKQLKIDNFALFDAVMKRGGFENVCVRRRWEQIHISLMYENNYYGFAKYYQQHLLGIEQQLASKLTHYQEEQLPHETYEVHLLPPNNLTASYYHLTTNQRLFVDTNFASLDQYFNIKTIVMLSSDFSKIPVEYANKIILARKWLLFANPLQPIHPKQLSLLGIATTPPYLSVLIIGISLPSMLLACKLGEFGMRVTILDKPRRQYKLQDEHTLVMGGILTLQGGRQSGSYYDNLVKNKCVIEQLRHNHMNLLDDEGKCFSYQKIRISEEHFIGVLSEFKGEIMNKNNLYEQLTTRVIKKKLDYERFMIKWHHDRYMLFNRIKGDLTTVSDLATYESKKYIKHISHQHIIAYLRSVQPLLQHLQQQSNIKFMFSNWEGLTNNGNDWDVRVGNEHYHASHLIFADEESICRGVMEGSSRMTDYGGNLLGEEGFILGHLTVMKYVNCLFRFKDKVVLRQTLRNQPHFSIHTPEGYLFCFLLNGETQLFTILKSYHNSSIDYCKFILNILENKCLGKGNRMATEPLSYNEYTFGLKQEKVIQNVIKIKPKQNMFLMMPITTTNCPHRMPAHLDLTNYIASNILHQAYQNLPIYNDNIKQLFKQTHKTKNNRVEKQQPSQVDKTELDVLKIVLQKNNNEEILKIKMLTGEKEEEMVEEITQNEGEIPSIEAVHKLNADWFGLKHHFVRSYQRYLAGQIEKMQTVSDGLLSVDSFELSQPLCLYGGMWLYSLGQPALKLRDQLKCILEEQPAGDNWLLLLQNMVSRRQYFSLCDTFRITIYFQTVISLQNKVLYCLIDEQIPSVVYYHSNLQSLITRMNDRLGEIRRQQLEQITLRKSYNNIRISRTTIKQEWKQELFPQTIAIIIKQQLAHSQHTLDDILTMKLTQNKNNPYTKKYMAAEQNIVELIHPIVDKTELILTQIQHYLHSSCLLYQLKPFSLFEVFFGVLSEQYMACQIMQKFTVQPLSLPQVATMDEPLSKELQEIFRKNIVNDNLSLMMIPNEKEVITTRNFIHPHKKRHFAPYSYKRTIREEQQDQHQLITLGQSQPTTYNQPNNIMKDIISMLVQWHSMHFIIQILQQLINQQINNQQQLTPRIKMYYRMTKKDMDNPSYLSKLRERCNKLSQEDKAKAYTLLKNNKIRWVQNDFVFIVS